MDRRKKRALVRMSHMAHNWLGSRGPSRPKGVSTRTVRGLGDLWLVDGIGVTAHGATTANRIRGARDGVAGLVRA